MRPAGLSGGTWVGACQRGLVILGELGVALALGVGLASLGLRGVSWMFAGIVAGVALPWLLHSWQGVAQRPLPQVRALGQMLVGVAVASTVSSTDWGALQRLIPGFLGLTFLTLSQCLGIGLLYARWSGTNRLAAILATMPGIAAVITSLAADYTREVSRVAVVQVLRLTTIILLVPFFARWVAGRPAVTPPSPWMTGLGEAHWASWGLLAGALAVGGLGAWGAQRLRWPAGAFVGALGGTLLWTWGLAWLRPAVHWVCPPVVQMLGQVLLGTVIGEYWALEPVLEWSVLLQALIPVGLTVTAGLGTAWVAWVLTPWDWLTCWLVTVPGGATEMVLVALALDQDVDLVTAGHLLRLVVLNTAIPLGLSLVRQKPSPVAPVAVTDGTPRT